MNENPNMSGNARMLRSAKSSKKTLKTRKIIAVLLTLILVFGCAPQVFAAAMMPGFGLIGGAVTTSTAAIMDDLMPYDEWCEEYIALNPDYIEEAYKWAASMYGIDEEEIEEYGGEYLIDEYLSYIYYWEYYADYYEQRSNRIKAETRIAMGGTASGLGVMFMGEYVKFGDAQPEFRNNRVMVPVRNVMEFLGANVQYGAQSSAVSIALENGGELYFEVGKTEITLKSDDDEKTIEMDVAPYIKNNQTYVPVRFFSEIFGYEVSWDPYYETVVILDKAALVTALDAKLTIMNSILFTQSAELGKAYKQEVDIKADVTQLDSIDGDKTAKLSASMTALVSDGITDLSGEFDLYDLIRMLEEYSGELIEDEYPEMSAEKFKKADFDIILDTAAEIMFIRSSILTGVELFSGGSAATANTWLKQHLYGISELMSETNSIAQGMTLGELLYNSSMSSVQATSLATFEEETAAILLLIGDDKFTTSGTDKILTITIDDIIEAIAAGGGDTEDYEELLDAAELKLTLSQTNGVSISITLKTGDSMYSSYYGVPKMLLTMELTGNDKGALLTMELHIKNTLKITAEVKVKMTETDEKPRTQPPESAEIISEYDDYLTGEILPPIMQMSQLTNTAAAD